MDNSLDNIPDDLIDIFSEGLHVTETDSTKNWITSSKENKKHYWELKDVWQASAVATSENDYDENKAWEKLRSGLTITKPAKRLGWLKYAAIAIIFSTLGSLTYYLLNPLPQPQPLSFQEVYVPYGSTSKIILPDGSYVWLNAGSYLKYNSLFNVKNRNIFLKGEAFFDVSKNKKLTFVVQTPGIEVKAIGTKFNVKAYPDEKTISTTVVEGKIQVLNQMDIRNKTNEIVLVANQTASYLKQFATTPVIEPEKTNQNQKPVAAIEKIPSKIIDVESDVNIDLFVSWHEGRLLIEREKLGSLAKKLERRYNIKMLFIDENVKNYVFSGVLKDETFEQVMDVIRLTSPLRFSIDGNIVKLTEDKSLKNRIK